MENNVFAHASRIIREAIANIDERIICKAIATIGDLSESAELGEILALLERAAALCDRRVQHEKTDD